MSNIVLSLQNIAHHYPEGSGTLQILSNVSLDLKKSTVTALLGVSGSGKSTLLHIAGLLEHPATGTITLLGEDCTRLSNKKRADRRCEHIGFVYQMHNLMPDFTALENVVIPQLLKGTNLKSAQAHAAQLLSNLGLGERLDHVPAKLSGGEQQRVAIARALANKPSVLLADEPTGNLDPHTGISVFETLVDLAKNQGLAVLLATHDHGLAQKADHIVHLDGGLLKN